MTSIERIKWVYDHCGLAAAIEVAIKFVAIDLVAIGAFAGYCLTLPFQFIWILCRGLGKGKL